jgi:DNA-binding MarR family transcriptional regulator
MAFLMLKHLPRYDCILEMAKQFPDLDPSACEAFLHLLRTGDEGFRYAETYFAECNLSRGRFTVLMFLFDKVKVQCISRTPAELAELAGVTRATMTGLVDTLERDDLVRREPDKDDRRMMLVTLTPKGEALLKSILPEHYRRIAALMATLAEDERKTLVRLLNKVVEQAQMLSTTEQAMETAHPKS